MINRYELAALLVAGGIVVTGAANLAAQSNSPQNSLDERIQNLEQEVLQLKFQREQEKNEAQKKAKETPTLVVGPDGFGFKSADGAFSGRLGGLLQTDARFFLNDNKHTATDTFLIRRARPIFEGTFYKDFSFRIMPDFGGGSTVLFDAYVNWAHWQEFQLRVGKFKTPVGLEQLQEDKDTFFVERGLPTDLVPNRDVGVQLWGNLWDGELVYQAGIFNGVVDGGNGDTDNGDPKDFAGRLFVQPFKKTDIAPLQGLGVGIAGSWGDQSGKGTTGNLPSYRTVGQQTFFSYITSTNGAGPVFAHGERTRWTPQGYYYWGPFGLIGEYVVSNQEVRRGAGTKIVTLSHNAWQVTGGFVVTGEKSSFKGVTPKRPFDLKTGGWGALELVARYGELHIDNDTFPTFANPNTAAKDVSEWGIGANWYLNRNIKLKVEYEHSTFEGGGAGGKDRPDEDVVFGRLQLAY